MSSLAAAVAPEDCAAFISGTLPGSRVCAEARRGWIVARLAAKTNQRANTLSFRILSTSGVNSALADRIGHAIDGQHVGCDAIVHLVGLGVADDVPEGRNHDFFQLLI